MKALVFRGGQLQLDGNWPDPKAGPDEVLIEVETAGICGTDIEICKGYMEYEGVLGHEFVGRVVKGPRELKDKRVVGEINCVCGKCDMCQSGLSNHCRDRQVIGIAGHDGVFAEYVALPRRNVHVLPDAVDNDEGIFVEPLAAALQIIRQVPIEARDKVIVVGDGRLGLLAVQVLAEQGNKSNVVLLGKHPEKLTFAEKRGIRGILLDDMVLKSHWDVVVDCTGSAGGFAVACQLVRPRGVLVLKSTWAVGAVVDLSPLVINEVKLIGSRCGTFVDAINTLAAEQVVVNGLITSRFKLADGEKAMRKAQEPGQIKVLIDVKD